MEEYVTDNLLKGGSEKFVKAGREQLSETQARIREQRKMVEFIRKNI